ncbi:MAG: DMT family transporter [Anaerovorax sp.]
MYILMTILVCIWGLDYIIAKNALETFQPMTLLFFKYSIGLVLVVAVKFKFEGKTLARKKDIPVFIACAVLGEIIYFSCEYTAMDYLPISLITIILAFVPALSVVLEKIIYKKKATKLMIVGIGLSIVGVALVIGVDYKMLFQGRAIGYLLAIGAVCSWNAFNFITASLHDKYESATLTMTQLLCTIILVAPYAMTHLPESSQITPSIIGGLIYLGLLSAGFGFLAQVKSLHILGPTATALFSNFLPITATFFGWLFLKETISIVQIVGGVVVIIAGYLVIKEKGRVEELSNE